MREEGLVGGNFKFLIGLKTLELAIHPFINYTSIIYSLDLLIYILVLSPNLLFQSEENWDKRRKGGA